MVQYFTIYGYARSKMTDEEFRDLISESLTCRLTDGEGCGQNMETFLSRCFYQAVRSGADAYSPGPACATHALSIFVKLGNALKA